MTAARATKAPPALDDLRTLLPDFRRHLRARNKAPDTIDSYLKIAREFTEYLVESGMPTIAADVGREYLEHYFVYLQERPNKRTGKPVSASYVAKHYRSLQQLFKWLDEVEELIDVSPFVKLSPPSIPEQPVPVRTEDELKALLTACKGKTLEDLRDRALILMFIDTGARCGEIAPLKLEGAGPDEPSDLDFESDQAHVMGKGRRGRTLQFSAVTGEALRRYLRTRARHKYASKTRALWIGRQGPLTESGIRRLIDRRADQAEIPHTYPHLFRHTFAHRWLASGGQEKDLMRLAGWRSSDMVYRYGASVADERARASHRSANLMDGLT
jgi:site-specific recombinase XerD